MNISRRSRAISLKAPAAILLALFLLGPGQVLAAMPPSEEEAIALGKAIEAGFATDDVAPFNQAMDVEVLLEASCAGIPTANARMKSFLSGFRRGVGKNFGDLAQQIRMAGDYKFLRVQDIDGRRTLLFRMLTSEGGVNYHRLILQRRASDQIKIVDIFIFALGESLSDTFRRVLLPMAAEAEKGFLERLVGKEADLVKFQKEWTQLPALAQQNNAADFLAGYQKLPATLQKEKFLLLMRIKATMNADTNEYQNALILWRDTYPNDPSIDLMSIDYYFMKNDYAKTLEVIESLDKSLGGDPYLQVLRGAQHKLAGRLEHARQCAQRALAAEPDLTQAHDLLLNISLEEKNYAGTVFLLKAAERALGVSMRQAVSSSPDYADFRRSPEYREWVKTGSSRSPAGTAVAPPRTRPPTTPTPPRPAAPVPGVKEDPHALNLQGIGGTASRPSALISGESVLVGDTVKNHKVVKIEPEQVTLESPEGKTLVLKLKGP